MKYRVTLILDDDKFNFWKRVLDKMHFVLWCRKICLLEGSKIEKLEEE